MSDMGDRGPARGRALVVALTLGAVMPLLGGGAEPVHAAQYQSWTWTDATPGPPVTRHTATLLTTGPNAGRVLVAGGDQCADPGCQKVDYDSPKAYLFDPATRTWSGAGSMHEGRSDHTATPLADGTVLVTGGRGGGTGACRASYNDQLASAELYDPTTNSWRWADLLSRPPGGPSCMRQARSGQVAVRQRDGWVAVFGGEDARDGPNSVERYRPGVGWVDGYNDGSPWSLTGHSAALLPDGRILIAGGERNVGPLSDATLFDPTRTPPVFTATGRMSVRRVGGVTVVGTAGRLAGRVLVTGGDDNVNGLVHASAEIYDPQTQSWTGAGSMSVPRVGHRAVVLGDGTALVAGGTQPPGTSELLDPGGAAAAVWRRPTPMRAARSGLTATVLRDGTVLALGGSHSVPAGDGSLTVYHNVPELYGPPQPMPPPPLCAAHPALAFDPAVVPLGRVTRLRGSGFCPGPLQLTWGGLGRGPMQATAGAGGGFELTLLLLDGEVPGGWTVRVLGPGGADARGPLLVVPRSSEPPRFVARR